MNKNRPLPIAVLLQFAAVAVAQQSMPSAPAAKSLHEAWQLALAQAGQHKAPVLAFVLPSVAGKAAPEAITALLAAERAVGMLRRKDGAAPPIVTTRDVLLREVQLLRVGDLAARHSDLQPNACQAIFALTVPVFATAQDCGARDGENVVLLGPDGRRLQGCTVDLLDREAFVTKLGGLVLEPTALLARRGNVPPNLVHDLERRRQIVVNTDPAGTALAELRQLDRRLSDNLTSLAPALVTRNDDKLEFAAEVTMASTRSPLGAVAEVLAGDPCPGCGMGYVPPALQTVLKLIGP